MHNLARKEGFREMHPAAVAGTANPPVSARGNDKEVIVSPDCVIVRAYNGNDVRWESKIPAENLCGVELKPAGRFGIGYLLVGVAGADGSCPGTRLDNIWDENTIYFDHSKEDQFVAVRAAIEQLLAH